MKNFTPAAVILFLFCIPGFSQDCSVALKDKGKYILQIKTWSGPMFTDMKFTKYKDEKKDELVRVFNTGASSGSIKPDKNYPLTYTYTKTASAGGDEYKLGTNIGGTDYYSYMVCKNDTLFFARNRGVMTVPDGNGGIYGYSIQGIQILPMKLKVGDELPAFTDLSIVLPTSTDMIVQKSIIDHYSTSTSNGFGYAQDKNGNWGLGPTTETKTSAVYRTIDVAVKKTVSFSGHTLHYSHVADEEEVTVNGIKYNAYVIEAEVWTKNKMDVDFESMDKQVEQQQKGFAKKVQRKMDKLMVRRQFTNDQGYMVMYSKQWFVPTIGAVKTETYDSFGAISSISDITGFE